MVDDTIANEKVDIEKMKQVDKIRKFIAMQEALARRAKINRDIAMNDYKKNVRLATLFFHLKNHPLTAQVNQKFILPGKLITSVLI